MKNGIANFIEILKLEITTSYGRVNVVGVFIIAIFELFYSVNDVFRHMISSVENVTKTIALQQDIYHEYETPNVIYATLPVFVGFVLCLIFLCWHEKRKKD